MIIQGGGGGGEGPFRRGGGVQLEILNKSGYRLYSGFRKTYNITETKLDESFPKHQFVLEGFNVIRNYFTLNSGGIMAFIRDDLTHARRPELEFSTHSNIQSLVIECIIRKEKWYFITFYKSPKVNNCDFIECVKRTTYDAISHAKETILVGDFNINLIIPDNVMVNEVCHVYNVRNLIKHPTCHKSTIRGVHC